MKKTIVMLLCAVMAVTGLSGCGKKAGGTNDAAKSESTKSTVKKVSAKEVSKPTEGLNSMFPLKKPVTLTFYIALPEEMGATMKDFGGVEFFKDLEKKTNVHIKWNHNTNDNSLSLMLAGGDLPDMINDKLGAVAGGVQSLVDDKVVADLTHVIPKYAPNYYDWMQKNPEEDKAFKLDDGTMYQFTNFNVDWKTKDIKYFNILGPQIRQDWLDKLGLKMPTNTDELYKVLCAFRDNDMNGDGDKTDEIPYVISNNVSDNMYTLAGSFGTRKDFHKQGDKIVYGPITDNFKQFIKYMHKLYEEKLINSDFGVAESKLDLLLQDKAGFTIASMGSGVIATHEVLKEKNPKAEFVSVPWLKGPDGDQCGVTDVNVNPRSTVITTACKHPDIAAAWLDYVYSQQGSMDSTFGIEGKSYDLKDGYPTISDSVKNNDKGWSMEQSMCRWMLGPINYPNARDYRFYEQINLNEDYKKDIQTNWDKQTDDILLPPLNFTAKESKEFSGVMSDIYTYVDENLTKFIIGKKDIDKEWGDYVKAIKSMGIGTALTDKEQAYARYQKK